MAMARMLGGLSARRYPVGLEPVGQRVERSASSSSKSAVSRRFVAATETALAELLAAPLSELNLVALMIDGVHFGEHLCVVALGIGVDGTKHPLGLGEGSTENTTVVTDLLTGLRDRGLDTSHPIFVGIDGGKALRAAVLRVFDHPVIQRCQLHYADHRIMPRLSRDPLCSTGFVLARSAQSGELSDACYSIVERRASWSRCCRRSCAGRWSRTSWGSPRICFGWATRGLRPASRCASSRIWIAG